jgi:hypothetical protein
MPNRKEERQGPQPVREPPSYEPNALEKSVQAKQQSNVGPFDPPAAPAGADAYDVTFAPTGTKRHRDVELSTVRYEEDERLNEEPPYLSPMAVVQAHQAAF